MGRLLGYTPDALAQANRLAIDQLVSLRSRLEEDGLNVVVSGCIGPRADGYDRFEGASRMDAQQARAYHAVQVETLAETDADMVNAMTIPSTEEAVGIVLAAQEAEIPVAIASDSLDAGDPLELAAQYAELPDTSPGLTVLGGCCGTDLRHLRAIASLLV